MTIPQIKVRKPGSAQGSSGVCIYGRIGVGKTMLLGTMPENAPGLVINVPQMEGGDQVLENKGDYITVTDVTTWNEVEGVYQYLKRGGHGYRWVAVDTITMIQRLAKRKTTRDRPLDLDPYKLSPQDYGTIGELMSEFIYKMRELPFLTIWLCQQRKNGSDEDNNATHGPDLTPMTAGALLPSMSIVARMYVEHNFDGTIERRLQLQPDPYYEAKTRVVPGIVVPQAIRNPNLNTLLRYVRGGVPITDLDAVDASLGIVEVPS